MDKEKVVRTAYNVLKFVGNIARDAADVGDYRLTVVLERKIDDRIGVVVDNIAVDQQMSTLQADLIMRNIREMLKRNDLFKAKK